jgi:two-component system, OmpR family, osmolarity sensor histidine kinase EnvZ
MNLSSEIKRFLPRRLLWRSLLIIMAPLVLLQVVTTIVFYDRHWETVTRRLAYSVAGDIAVAIVMLSDRPDDAGAAAVTDLALNHMSLKLWLDRGAILPNTPAPKPRGMVEEWLTQALHDQLRKPFRIDARTHSREVEIFVQLPDGVLRVLAPNKRLSSITTYVVLLWMFGTSAVLFVIAMLFMRNQVRPILRLAEAAESFGKGRDQPQFRPSGATEVRRAARAFIEMRERIKRQMQQRTDMLSGVSHDLRTPLTRMKLQLALQPDSDDTRELKRDVEDMERMVEGYLAFARGEGEDPAEETDISRLLADVVEGARRDGASIELSAEDGIRVPARANALKRAVTNLVVNAARYGKTVMVRAVRQGGGVQITVEDDGPGIPSERREDAFRPFVRLEGSRNPETGGIGLGLTIARDVARSHGGDVTLDESPLGGLRARLRLPA